MSHYTQDPKKLQLLADYYAGQPATEEQPKLPDAQRGTLKKLNGSSEFMTQTFTGSFREEPKVGNQFLIILSGNIDYSWFRTSLVTSVVKTDTGFIFSTLNSEYSLDIISE